MIKSLVLTDNIDFIKNLADEINSKKLNIQLSLFSRTIEETENILEYFNPDIIFLDRALEKIYDRNFCKKHIFSIIRLSNDAIYNLSTPKNMSIIQSFDFKRKRDIIMNELHSIGYKFEHCGTHYLTDTILQMYLNKDSMLDNLQRDIFPVIARKYHKTPFNIKSNINKATVCMYSECDSKKLMTYFHFCYDTKPTVKQVVFTVLNKIL